MQVAPHLLFNGNCREVMNFYAQCFNGLLEIVAYEDWPSDEPEFPKKINGKDDAVIYSSLRHQDTILPFLTAADLLTQTQSSQPNNGQVSVDCKNEIELNTLFEVLSQGGEIIQPLTNVFWSVRLGQVVDKYGVHWLLTFSVN